MVGEGFWDDMREVCGGLREERGLWWFERNLRGFDRGFRERFQWVL